MIDILKPLIKQFMPFAQQKMGFSRPPRLFLRKDDQNAANPMGKTGFYDPQKEAITLYITGRHPKDIMRSLAHELQHHTQKCNGDFESVQNMGEEGYAQADPHMRTMEIQAYQASIVFRDWEDSCKGTIYYEQLQKGDNSSMSTKDWKNGEINTLLNEKWGFTFKVDALSGKKEILKEYTTKKKDPEVTTGREDAQQACAKKVGHEWNTGLAKCLPEKKKEKGSIEEMCPAMEPEEAEGGHEMMVIGGAEGEEGEEGEEGVEEDPAALADELLDVAQRLAGALGGGEEAVEMEPDLEERRGRGRENHTIRGPKDNRLRPEGKDLSEAQIRSLIRKALKEVAKTKGK